MEPKDSSTAECHFSVFGGYDKDPPIFHFFM